MWNARELILLPLLPSLVPPRVHDQHFGLHAPHEFGGPSTWRHSNKLVDQYREMPSIFKKGVKLLPGPAVQNGSFFQACPPRLGLKVGRQKLGKESELGATAPQFHRLRGARHSKNLHLRPEAAK